MGYVDIWGEIFAAERSLGEITFASLPTAILPSALLTQSGQFLWMRMKKAQFPFRGGRLAWTTSLRLSFALLSTPLF